MKKIKNGGYFYGYVFLFICAFTLVTSCKKNYLENEPRNTIVGENQWADETTADLFLNDIYRNLNNMSNTTDPLDSYTDDNDGGPYWKSWRWKQGIIGPAVEGGTPLNNDNNASGFTDWKSVYEKVRKCNTFLKEVDLHASNFSVDYINKRKDEVRFLRAFYYSYLWMHLGGLAIITEPQDRNTNTPEELYKSRSTFEETFNFIDKELETVVNNKFLSNKYNFGQSDAGRATLGAALALKGWIELYAASPAFNTSTPVVGQDPGHLVSFATSDQARYAKAAATNKQFIELLGGTYSLFTSLSTFWTEANEYNSEVIWDRQVVRNIGNDLGSNFLMYGGPVFIQDQYLTWGNYNPTQELVDDFKTDQGLPITDPASNYNPQNPYLHREQRFYDFIVYDGAPYKMNWMTTPDVIYTRIDKVKPSKNEIDFGSYDVSNTAYYFKKRINPDIRPTANNADGLNYVYFRYAEILLNYAEAQNESAGPDASVYNALNQIRVRAGLPTLETTYGGQSLSKEKMRTLIRSERRVELCFENKRFYDIIRWGTAMELMNKDNHGMKITNTSPADNKGTWVYERVPLNHPHVFTQKMYMNPIPQNVIDQNPKIKQNPNY